MITKYWNVQNKCRLDEFLRIQLPGLFKDAEVSNGKIRRLIVAGCVFVDGRQCRVPAYVVLKNSKVCVEIEEEKFFYEKQPKDVDFELTAENVLYEDEYIIVVNKPAFLPTEGTIVKSRKSMHSCVIDYLWKKNPSLRNPPYAGIMHRLDHETSGVLLFTKKREANKAVSDMFQNHTAVKTYRAVSSRSSQKNKDLEKNFSVENFIGRITPKSAKCRIGILPESKGGQYARTEFTVAAEKEDKIFINCRLFTGRTHQIRVHLSGVGLPISGDELYGGIPGSRIMLHARSLEFPHPVTGEQMKVEAPLPDGFDA